MPYVGRVPSAVPVTADDIPANSIDASKITDGSIELAEIADNSITDAKLNSSKLDGIETGATNYIHPTTHATADIADNAITEAKIADAAVVSLKSGRKNLIINGGFDVWQRGTSFSGSAEYSSDRWKTQTAGNVGTTTRSTDAPDISRYSAKVAITGTAAFIQFGQQTEFANFHTMRGKTLTLSFWAKGAGITALKSRMRQGTTTEDEVAVFVAPTLSVQTKTINTVWQKFTHTFTIGATATAISTDFSASSVVSGNEIYIAQVQLELGSVATDFEHRSYGEELALCQRYWQQSYEIGTQAGTVTSEGCYQNRTGTSTSGMYRHITLPVGMRTAPTITLYGTSSTTNTAGKWRGSNDAAISMSPSYSSHNSFNVSGNMNQSYTYLSGHWTADSEL
jgi:hypothetical protein